MVILFLFVFEQGLLQCDLSPTALSSDRNHEKGYGDDNVRDELIDLDKHKEKLPHGLVRCEDVNSLTLRASEVIVKVDAENEDKSPQ